MKIKKNPILYICQDKFQVKHAYDEAHHEVRDHCYYTEEYRYCILDMQFKL